MIRSLLLILAIGVSSVLGAQSKTDSLWKVYKNTHNCDTCRLAALYKLGGGMFQTRPDSTVKLDDLIIKQAGNIKAYRYAGIALTQKGEALYTMGRTDESFASLSEAITILKKFGYERDRWRTHSVIGDLTTRTNPPLGLKKIRESIDAFTKLSAISERGLAYGRLGRFFASRGRFDSAQVYMEKDIADFLALGDSLHAAGSMMNLSVAYRVSGDYRKALKVNKEALGVFERKGDKRRMGLALQNIGSIQINLGEQDIAIKNLYRSLKIREKIQDIKGLAYCHSILGTTYNIRDNDVEALKHYTTSMRLAKQFKDFRMAGDCHIKIGDIYLNRNELDSAEFHLHTGTSMLEKTRDMKGIAQAKQKLGRYYFKTNRYAESEDALKEARGIFEQIKYPKGISQTTKLLGDLYYGQEDFAKAFKMYDKAATIAVGIGEVLSQEGAAEGAYKSAKKIGKNAEALKYYELFITIRDSTENLATEKEFLEQEMAFKFEKEEALANQAHEQELKQKEFEAASDKRQQNIIIAAVVAGLLLVLIFSVFLFRRFKITQQQKVVIEEQKEKVDEAFVVLEEKNKEILDSIEYAKRIQSAILPPQKLIKEYLTNSFILYMPKDIVAGDFYWMETIGDEVLFAAADCTGHGVPGAMVSVMCSNALTKAVKEDRITSPAGILDKAVEYLEAQFEKSEEVVNDGMDLALCKLNVKSMQLEYSGANNPLWIIPTSSESITDVVEIKANKQPVGKYDHRVPFTNHQVQLNHGDTVYIFSDGFVDQFGGVKGKKFKSKPFKQLLIDNKSASMDTQRDIIRTTFENWRGSIEQIDDVCVIGVRV